MGWGRRAAGRSVVARAAPGIAAQFSDAPGPQSVVNKKKGGW
jgi:hypothetical protein